MNDNGNVASTGLHACHVCCCITPPHPPHVHVQAEGCPKRPVLGHFFLVTRYRDLFCDQAGSGGGGGIAQSSFGGGPDRTPPPPPPTPVISSPAPQPITLTLRRAGSIPLAGGRGCLEQRGRAGAIRVFCSWIRIFACSSARRFYSWPKPRRPKSRRRESRRPKPKRSRCVHHLIMPWIPPAIGDR